MQIVDSLTNLVAGLGTTKDKATHDHFTFRPLSETELDALYHGSWIAKKIVDLPVADTFRDWRTWQATPAAVNAFEAAEKRHAVKRKLAKALTLARVYGGSAILIGADVADPSRPLNLDAVRRGGLAYLTVIPRRNITAGPPDRDPRSPSFGEPEFYTLATGTGAGVKMHPSRVIRFVGSERLDLAGESDGWGFSALQAPYEAVHHAALATGSAASMLHEAKVDVISIPNLGSVLASQDGTAALTRRFSLASMMKSINNTLLLGADEKWERTTTAFTGVPQLIERFMAVAAAAADIPAARFLGQSASGLNASGNTDVRNYYDRLAGEREAILTPAIERLDAVLWRDATGKAPSAGTVFAWNSLWQPTDKERVDTAKTLADTVTALVNTALLSEDALRVGVENALIECGVFPGLEHALASATVANDPAGEDDPERPLAASEDHQTRDSIPRGRARLTALVVAARDRAKRGGGPAYH